MKRLFTLAVLAVMLVMPSSAQTDATDYLTFMGALTNSTTKISFVKNGTLKSTPKLQYAMGQVSTRNPSTIVRAEWKDYEFGTEIDLPTGSVVSFRAAVVVSKDLTKTGKNATFSEDPINCITFQSTGEVRASGNIMSLLDASCKQTSVPDYAFNRLFERCSYLKRAPKLPATTVGISSYLGMFKYCTNLTTAPDLPATTLAGRCYYLMFEGCTKLTTAPALPATTLAPLCYLNMFYGCTKLTTAPALPATTLVNGCYNGMFAGCKNLNSVTVGFTDWSEANHATENWLDSVATTGTITCGKELDLSKRSASYIPEGWTANLFPDYLCFTSKSEGSGVFIFEWGTTNTIPAIQYSKDRINWTDYIIEEGKTNGETFSLNNQNEKIYFKAKTTNATFNTSNCGVEFIGWGNFDVSGNIMSLLDETCKQTEVPEYAFNGLFAGMNSSLFSAPELPATTLGNGCYMGMFMGCTNLTKAPELPATTLKTDCYKNMFSGCSQLTSAPILPATTLVDGCYYHMFNGCSFLGSLTVSFTDWKEANNATTDWLKGVAERGRFYGPVDIDDKYDDSHIPVGWRHVTYGSRLVTASANNISKLIELLNNGGEYSQKYDFDDDGDLDLDDVEAMKCAVLGIHYCPTVEIGGVKWATMNIGANNPRDIGDYFAWGATESYAKQKKSYDWNTYCGVNTGVFQELDPLPYNTTTYVLKPEYDAAHVNWSGDWRMPTKEDFANLLKACGCDEPESYFDHTVCGDNDQPTEKGIYSVGACMLFIDGSGNKLYLPMAGYYFGDYVYYNEYSDLQLQYWSSTLNNSEPEMAYGLWRWVRDGKCITIPAIGFISRVWGMPIRPVK